MIIAFGVKRRAIAPRGPCRLNRPYRTSPTTTVGRAIRVLRSVITSRRPGKVPTATAMPAGMPAREARRMAQRETVSEVPTALKTSPSREQMRDREVVNDSRMKPTLLLLAVDEEDRVAVDLVAGDDSLSFRAGDEVDKPHGQFVLDVGMPLRVDGDHPVRVEQPLFPLEQDLQVGLAALEGVVGPTVRQGIGPPLGCHDDHLAHSLARRLVPFALGLYPRGLPELLLLLVGPGFVAAGDESCLFGGDHLQRFGGGPRPLDAGGV